MKSMDKKEVARVLNNNKDLLALYQKVVDKLEKRIATLEKVLASHAKCIGELRVKDNQFEINADGTETKKDSIL
jgi:F420-0:gamma-glutamyl ligase